MWQQLITLTALVFFLSSIVNVVLNTIKSIITIKGRTLHAAISNAITFGFYTFIVKQMAEVDLIVSIPLTMIANFLGVYLAKWILSLFQKDVTWRISCTIPDSKAVPMEVFAEHFNQYGKKCDIIYLSQGGYIVDFYAQTQMDSLIAKEIINKYNIKYHIIECEKSL